MEAENIAEKSPKIFISFKNVGVCVNGNNLVENVNAQVPAGRNTVLIGPNGAGKSTLLHCLTGEYEYSGQIEWHDRANEKIRIAYVPQQASVERSLPLTVMEFIACALQLRPLWLGIPQRIKRRVGRLLDLTGCGHLAARSLGRLSGGEQRRVLLAAALSRKPDLLLLDEPEAGVDVKGEKQLWELLERLRKQFGFTELIVSHNLSFARRFANWVIGIDKTVIAQGPPQAVMNTDTLERLFGLAVF